METILKNKYVRRAKISEYKFRKLLKYFAEDLSATQISLLTQINRNTVNRYLNEIRKRIVEFCEQYSPLPEALKTENTIHGMSKLQAIGEKISTNLGLLKRRGKICATLLANYTADKIRAVLNTELDAALTVHAVEIKEDNGLLVIGYDNKPHKTANYPSYVNNLDNFWRFMHMRLNKFNGLAKHKIYLHLKECEFRFNFRNDNLYAVMLQLIGNKPIS